jgi:hypothetical protein
MTREAAFALLDSLKPDKRGCINFVGVRGTSPVGYRYFLFVDGQQVSANRLALERKLKRPIHDSFRQGICAAILAASTPNTLQK